MERTYEHALDILQSRVRPQRPKATSSKETSVQSANVASDKRNLRGSPSIEGMSQWLQALGHSSESIDRLNIIHIAGTKGKGSTCSFTESFLRAHGKRTEFPRKTGLYTSPHLMVTEERIRLNSLPLDRDLFAKYFFEVYDRLPQLALPYDPTKPVVERGPRYLQLFALFAFHVFIREKVDVAIFETHNGGEYDATNVVQKPLVTAITTLGMDHVEMLGPSIKDIAWHKAGIFKAGSELLSTTQDTAPAETLRDRAVEKGGEVRFVDEDNRFPADAPQLKPAVQRKNASLAVAIAEALLQRVAMLDVQHLNQDDIVNGVQEWSWPGRFQVVPNGRLTWFLDAAHNEMSVKIASQWFAERSPESGSALLRIAIFSHISELRDTVGVSTSLAHALHHAGVDMQHIIFSTYNEDSQNAGGAHADDSGLFHQAWGTAYPRAEIWEEPTIRGAIDRARSVAGLHQESDVHVLITGSQHLVGPALRVLMNT